MPRQPDRLESVRHEQEGAWRPSGGRFQQVCLRRGGRGTFPPRAHCFWRLIIFALFPVDAPPHLHLPFLLPDPVIIILSLP